MLKNDCYGAERMPTFRVLGKDDPRLNRSRAAREERLRPYREFLEGVSPAVPFEVTLEPDESRMAAVKGLNAAAKDLGLTLERVTKKHLIYRISSPEQPSS